jgi:RHH-type proline utilization regulon transcriptional repressor/proline dehydrogenase/delta 1-pyrroline-5-carboxylate dehydrogenase
MAQLDLPAFRNEPVLELRRASERDRLTDALAALDARLPLRVPVWIADDRREGDELVSTDPAEPGRVVATAAIATPAEVDQAVATAKSAQPAWAQTPAADRAHALVLAASLLRRERTELAALTVRECGKPWKEADADVCEAIDFLEYYARGAIELERGAALLQVPGERNSLRYAPRGVTAVISPWNFPLAIPLGMTAAALATGNTAVLKPAEQAPGCALRIVEALRAGGVPAEAIALLPGAGETGKALAEHRDVATIAFTGSGAVGLELMRSATAAPQRQLKRVVAEMGGKNCVIVDADADLDDAVPAIVQSAFDYAGQKCSAASRVLVHEALADALLERLGGAAGVLQLGPAARWGTDVPPVIEREASERVERYAALARKQGRVVAEARVGGGMTDGHYTAARVVTDLPSTSEILTDEIFGPLLAVERVASVEQACDRVDELPFALTGGLFSRNPHVVEEVVRRTPVGNLYVNRGITGAMVARQPFGGNRLSGTGTKAGGPGYLLQFVEPRVVTENTVRHGLVV